MYTIDLPMRLAECPVYWQNFVKSMLESGKTVPEQGVEPCMPEFNATWEFKDRGPTFQTEEDYLIFKLKFC